MAGGMVADKPEASARVVVVAVAVCVAQPPSAVIQRLRRCSMPWPWPLQARGVSPGPFSLRVFPIGTRLSPTYEYRLEPGLCS